MTRDDIIRMAREAGAGVAVTMSSPGGIAAAEFRGEGLERFAAMVAAAERETWPNLEYVASWLEGGFDPQEAAKELRRHAAAIRARSTK